MKEKLKFPPFLNVIHIAEVYSLFLSICKSTKNADTKNFYVDILN